MASRMAYSMWTPQKPTLFVGHYLRNCSTLDIGVLGYIGIVQHKEHSPEVLSISPGTPCIFMLRKSCNDGEVETLWHWSPTWNNYVRNLVFMLFNICNMLF